MAVKNIPDEHHVVRYCKKNLTIREDGTIIGVFPEMFHLRAATPTRKQEEYLSAVYYEHFRGTPSERMKACRGGIQLSLTPKDALVRLNVKAVKEQGAKRKRSLRVTHEPSKECPSYAAIRQLPVEPDDELCNLLASLAVVEIVQVSALPP
jgi:hypothetical protein